MISEVAQRQLDNPTEYVAGPSKRYPDGLRRRTPLGMRFSEHYEPGSPDECWIWTGKCQWTGHAKFNLDNTWMQASRIMFYLTEGYFPPVVRHTCDNPPCVNPYHLLGGTQADNLRDMSNRGRARGQNMTHCLRGHPISGPDADVYISKRGQRQCRACVRITVNRRRALYGRRRA